MEDRLGLVLQKAELRADRLSNGRTRTSCSYPPKLRPCAALNRGPVKCLEAVVLLLLLQCSLHRTCTADGPTLYRYVVYHQESVLQDCVSEVLVAHKGRAQILKPLFCSQTHLCHHGWMAI